MGFHDRMRNMVIRQLALTPKGKGVPVVFHKESGGDYDPATGGVTPIVETDYAGSGVRVNYSDYALKNTTIEAGDFQVYLSPVRTDGGEMPTPTVGETFTFINDKVRVIKVSPFNNNATNCGWKVQVRYG